MPNSICNFDLFPIKNGELFEVKLKAADKKSDHIIRHLQKGKVTKRGFNWFSNLIGILACC
ncbi:MAG TPA: hypothetical protein DCY20_01530 [Firmicutes bacterium]|nr:hypothetical protein [Bacillota bacterium]